MYQNMDDFGDFYEGTDLVSGMGEGASMGAMGGPWGMLAGAGVGLVKHVGDKRAHNRMLQDRATQIRLAPFTGANIQKLADTGAAPNPWGNALAFGSTGAGIGQSFDKAANQARVSAAEVRLMDRMQPAQPKLDYGTVFANEAPRGPRPEFLDYDNNMLEEFGPWRGYG
jgi:hypothetical protein